MWSALDTERLRARFSGQFRIVGLSYVGGGGVAAACLVAVVLLTPAGNAVREALTLPLAQLVEQLAPAGSMPVRTVVLDPRLPRRAVLARDDAPLSAPAVDVSVADVAVRLAPAQSTAVAVDQVLTQPVRPDPSRRL